MAKQLSVNSEYVRNIVKYELGLRPYNVQKAHYLEDAMEAKRVERCRHLLTWLANRAHEKLLFSDESPFTVKQLLNKQMIAH